MAIANWLTRDEWNAVYFLGGKAGMDGAPCTDLGMQLRLGIGALAKAGYKFQGITADENGEFEKVEQCCAGNETVLVELITGEFDMLGRAKEAIAWAKEHAPNVDFKWLEEVIEKVEKGQS
jgi:hypothetical protein